jgi:hypothetical protein
MTNSKYWMGCVTMTLLLGAAGCAPAHDLHDDRAPSFREGDGPWGGGLLNTNFLGEDETIPLNAIPLDDDPNADVRLHAVWTRRCLDPSSGLPALFYTSDLQGELGVTLDGEGSLNPATFKMFSNASVTCQIAGNDWEHTVWGVMIKDAQGVWQNHYLMILDVGVDEHGAPIHEWGVYRGPSKDLFHPSNYQRTCIEDVDGDGDVQLHSFHAYLLDDLAVDPDSGDFSYSPDMMYLACRSGMVGKGLVWEYYPWEHGMDVHEIVTRAGRADYCGDGVSWTQPGTRLQIRDIFDVHDFGEPLATDEAAWTLASGRATCLTNPRIATVDPAQVICTDANNQPFALPPCTAAHMGEADVATKLPL